MCWFFYITITVDTVNIRKHAFEQPAKASAEQPAKASGLLTYENTLSNSPLRRAVPILRVLISFVGKFITRLDQDDSQYRRHLTF
jgi:hypothetical protein